MTFPAEHKKPTHSLLLFSQIIHGATLSTSLNPETSSTLTLLHHTQTGASRDKAAKDISWSCNETQRTGISLPPHLVHGYWDSHLQITASCFCREIPGLKDHRYVPGPTSGYQKLLNHWDEKQQCSHNISSCRHTTENIPGEDKTVLGHCHSSRKVFPLPPSHPTGSRDAP